MQVQAAPAVQTAQPLAATAASVPAACASENSICCSGARGRLQPDHDEALRRRWC